MTLDHPDYRDLLAAVLADPADDVPRLVLADWLQDNAKDVDCGRCKGRSDWHDALTGDGRCLDCKGSGRVPNGFTEYGEFVRVQVELATKSDCPDWCDHDPAKCRVEALRERERELWDRHKCDWFGDRWAILCLDGDHVGQYPDNVTAVVRRGFVDEIRCPLRLWVGDGAVGGIGPELVRRCPLSRVTLTDREPYQNAAGAWLWVAASLRRHPRMEHADIPSGLFALLSDDIDIRSRSAWRTYSTRQTALDALSAACLGWARATPTNTTESPREGATR